MRNPQFLTHWATCRIKSQGWIISAESRRLGGWRWAIDLFTKISFCRRESIIRKHRWNKGSRRACRSWRSRNNRRRRRGKIAQEQALSWWIILLGMMEVLLANNLKKVLLQPWIKAHREFNYNLRSNQLLLKIISVLFSQEAHRWKKK